MSACRWWLQLNNTYTNGSKILCFTTSIIMRLCDLVVAKVPPVTVSLLADKKAKLALHCLEGDPQSGAVTANSNDTFSCASLVNLQNSSTMHTSVLA